jgi:hypothetical protein
MPMMDDQYSYPYAEHPSYSPPPDYTGVNPIDYSSATPDIPPMAPSTWQPLGAAMFGDTLNSFLTSFISWFNAVRSS